MIQKFKISLEIYQPKILIFKFIASACLCKLYKAMALHLNKITAFVDI